MSQPVVQTHQLTKRYGGFTALGDCTLEIGSGQVFGLLGPNGAGKTTLLRLLLGFLRPTGGWASIDGLDCYARRVQVHRRLTYLPGEPRLFGSMRGRSVLKFFADIRPDASFQRALDLANRLELDLSRRVLFMSTGMRQKLALAACLSAESPLVILDEPTSNLDPNVRHEVLRLVADARGAGRTVIFSSHVLSEVEEVGDRVGILRGGRLVHVSDLDHLRNRQRISAVVRGPLPDLPLGLRDEVRVTRGANGLVQLDAPADLTPLLGWLASSPLENVVVESAGLRAVYQQYHQLAEIAETV